MPGSNPVIRETAYCLAHVPDLVRFGSKPRREIHANAAVDSQIAAALRSYTDAVRYPPNRVFVGDLSPNALATIEQPWFRSDEVVPALSSIGPFGQIVSQDLFYALVKQADVQHPPLFELTDQGCALLTTAARDSSLFAERSSEFTGVAASELEKNGDAETGLRILSGETLVGCFQADNRAEGRGDHNLSAPHLLEALCSKASGAMACSRCSNDPELSPIKLTI